MKILEIEQYSDKWWAARLGKPSASNGKKLVTSTGAASKSMTDYAIDLGNDLYAGKALEQWAGNKWTERGTELEQEARDFYSFMTDNDVTEIGMFTDDTNAFSASPDGIIGDDGLLEIKCLSSKVHTKALMYYRKNGKAPTDYVSQIQMQLMVSEREWCDLLLYSPDLPSLIITSHPDQEFHKTLRRQLEVVLAERNKVVELLRSYK